MEKYLNIIKELSLSEFNRGYMAALLLILALLILLMGLRFLCWLVFRTKRCSAVEIRQPDGTLIIAREALFGAIRQVLADYPSLPVRQLQLYRKGKSYRLVLFCSYSREGDSGLPELVSRIKQQLRDELANTFGFTALKAIHLKIEALETGYRTGMPAPAKSQLLPVAGETESSSSSEEK